MKFVIILAFLAILASLGSALFFMMRKPDGADDDGQRSKKMFRALALRVALSVVLKQSALRLFILYFSINKH